MGLSEQEREALAVRAVLDEWGFPARDGITAADDFAEAIQENGAWRFVRDLRAALNQNATP